MACASALRQLRTFNVEVPLFGFLWAQGRVRAHIDWCGDPEGAEAPVSHFTQSLRDRF